MRWPHHAARAAGGAVLGGAVLAAAAGGLLACAPRADQATTLTVWEQMDPAQQTLLRSQLDAFEQLHPGVRVQTDHFETDRLRSQFQTAGLAGAGPDLVYGPSDQVGPFSIMGLIRPLEEVIHADSLALFIETARPSLDGHTYALADQVGNHLTLVYNRKLVAQPPEDTDAWLASARQLTVDRDGDGHVDQFGIAMNMTEPFWLVPWLGAFGGWVMDAHNQPTLDDPALAQALVFLRSLVEAGVIPPNCDYPLADTLFKQGDAAYVVNGPWSWQSYREAGIDVGLAVLPRLVATGRRPTPMTASLGYSMNIHVPKAREALVVELLGFLTSAPRVAEVSRALSALPGRIDVAQWPGIAEDPVLQISWRQAQLGRPMPIVPEMRGIWDVMRPAFQRVMGGSMRADEAPAWVQAQALRKIQEMRL